MITWMRERLNKEEGFTLVELMVVVLIIAILIAIAIPTFLGARQRAQDRAAQSSLRNALTAEKVFYVDNEQYATSATDVDADGTADLTEIEPSLTWVAAASTDPVEVYVRVAGANSQVVCLEAFSEAGDTFYLADSAQDNDLAGIAAGTYYGSGAASTGCDAATLGGFGASW